MTKSITPESVKNDVKSVNVPKTEENYSKPGYAYIHTDCSAYAFYLFEMPEEGDIVKGFDYQGRRLHGAIKCLSCGRPVDNLNRANIVEIKK